MGLFQFKSFFFGEISRHVFDKMSILNGRKRQSWLVLDSYETAVVSGFVASSKMLDQFQKHMLFVRLSFCCGFFAYIGSILGIYFSNVIGLSFFSIALGFGVGFFIYHFTTQKCNICFLPNLRFYWP